MSGTPSTALSDIAERAYVYGFPLVFNLRQARRYLSTWCGRQPGCAVQRVQSCPAAGHTSRPFVTIKNDTVYWRPTLAGVRLIEFPTHVSPPSSAGGRSAVRTICRSWINCRMPSA